MLAILQWQRYKPLMMRRLSFAFALGLLLSGCAGKETTRPGPLADEEPVEVLYNRAMDASEAGDLRTAAEWFEEVERQHPYSRWATRAQLMYGFTLYEDQRYIEAITALERFISLHPAHKDVPYAYYLIALSHYEQISDVGRDQLATEQALAALKQVARRYPGTPYARDAQLKVDLTRDHLAGKQMEIGRFYQNQRQHLAAINRFKKVVDEFDTTSHAAEALHRLTESYLALGLNEEAKRNAAILGHNYPGSRWYEDSYRLLSRAGIG